MSIVHFPLSIIQGLFQPLNSIGVLDHLDGVGGELAAGNKLELSDLAEILAVEFERLAPYDVDFLDVINGEVFGGDCAFGGEAGAKGSHFAEGHAVAFEDELFQTENCLGEDGCDIAVVIDATVVGNVLCELSARNSCGLVLGRRPWWRSLARFSWFRASCF